MEPHEHVRELGPGEEFRFRCHPGIPCFTQCCRELELELTPYDCLRLKRRLGLDSQALLRQYVIVEKAEDEPFPHCYLSMVDDGRASCMFVGGQGCSVYEDRPGACRAYPLGRGAYLDEEKRPREMHVLLREPHCRGFEEQRSETAVSYGLAQGLDRYNAFNDLLMGITQHPRIRAGMRPSEAQVQQYMLGLYNLDAFRKGLCEDALALPWPADMRSLRALAGDDEELLRLGLRWLRYQLFGEL